MTEEDWKTHRKALPNGKTARVDLTDIELDALIAIAGFVGENRAVTLGPHKLSALFRATAKVKLARASMPPSTAEIERDKKPGR